MKNKIIAIVRRVEWNCRPRQKPTIMASLQMADPATGNITDGFLMIPNGIKVESGQQLTIRFSDQ